MEDLKGIMALLSGLRIRCWGTSICLGGGPKKKRERERKERKEGRKEGRKEERKKETKKLPVFTLGLLTPHNGSLCLEKSPCHVITDLLVIRTTTKKVFYAKHSFDFIKEYTLVGLLK